MQVCQGCGGEKVNRALTSLSSFIHNNCYCSCVKHYVFCAGKKISLKIVKSNVQLSPYLTVSSLMECRQQVRQWIRWTHFYPHICETAAVMKVFMTILPRRAETFSRLVKQQKTKLPIIDYFDVQLIDLLVLCHVMSCHLMSYDIKLNIYVLDCCKVIKHTYYFAYMT